MRKEETKEKGIAPKKDAGGTKAATSSGLGLRTWLGLKDPRIVRVSRSFGGKDRHSKVSTVKGLRDRRVRLSVQTAIQLYDLQDRLGLNQPSKVVDWLLNATQHEIDKLPPLQMPPAGNVAGGNCSSADLSQPHDHYHHQMDSSIYIKMLTENGDAGINNGFNMFGSRTATRGGTAGRGLMLSNNPNESTRSSWNSDNSSTAGRTESMDQPQQRCGGAEQTDKGALLANSTLFPYNGAGMCTTSYFHMETPPGGAEEPSEAVASLMLSSQPDHQTSNFNGTYNHRPITLSPPASLSLMPRPQLMLCPSGRSPMAPIFLSNNAGTTPVQYDAKHLTQVDYLSAHNAQFTPQSFFSGSLFASFPTVIPTTPYIPNPK